MSTDPTERKRPEEVLRDAASQQPGRRKFGRIWEVGVVIALSALGGWVLYATDLLQASTNKLLKYSERFDEVIGMFVIFGLGLAVLAYRWRQERRSQRIAELARANEVLRAEIIERQRAEARYRGTLDSMMEGGQIIGRDWRYLYLNEVAVQQSRRPAAELLGHTMMECYQGIESTPMFAVIKRCMEGGRPEQMENTFAYPDGTKASFQLGIQSVPEGVFILSLDVTEHRKLEEQLRQAQKMEAIGTLAGGIAHDFNNILAVINGYTELLKLSLPDNPEVSEHLDAVAQAGARATSLVQQILTFSRREETQREPMQLAPVVEEAMKFLRSTIPATIEIHTALAANTPIVLADATQVHQIVMNLGTNAWHAMRGRAGRLDVKLESFDIDSDLAESKPGLRPGHYARLSVSDTGKGMDHATLGRIFEPFFTTKPVGEGTGLGLSVVHGIMQTHGGAITVYSEPGQGTTFHLYFPAHTSRESVAEVRKAAVPPGNGERILYVDDEAPLARLGKKFLERLGYAAEARTDVMEALELVRAEPGRFDLVITDQTMPVMTGTDFARQIGQIRPDLPIILTTGYIGQMKIEQLRTMGIRELLIKPPTIQSLGALVHRVLADKTPK